jgi:hypothetical protein
MVKSMKVAGVAAVAILSLMPALALAQTHAHPARHTLSKAAHRTAVQPEWMALAQPASQPAAQNTCQAVSCRPMEMFGIGY